MTMRDMVSLADKVMDKGVVEFDILGGEPLLIPYMKDFLSYVISAGVTVHISTNGSLPDEVHTLAKICSPQLHIGFSLHGFSDTHNTMTGSDNFSMVIKGIQGAVSEGGNPIVKSVLTPANKNDVIGLIHHLGELGVKRYCLLHEDIIGRNRTTNCFSFPDFMSYFSQIRSQLQGDIDIGFVAASGFRRQGRHIRRRCDAGYTKLAILPDGSAFPCNLLLGFKEFRLGNILSDSLDSILNHPALETFRMSDGSVCTATTCPHYSTCSGGCPAHSYCFYRHVEARDPRCTLPQKCIFHDDLW